MKTVHDLCSFLDSSLGLQTGTAEAYAKNLRVADLLSKSKAGRGSRGGPDATVSDAVALLLALTASDTATGAVETVERFALLDFAGIVHHQGIAGDYKAFRASPDLEAAPQTAPLRQPLFLVICDLIHAKRAGTADTPGAVPLGIGLYRSGEAPSCWISIAADAPPNDAVRVASAVYTVDGKPPAHDALCVVKAAFIPASLISELADFFGPLPLETASADGAMTESAR